MPTYPQHPPLVLPSWDALDLGAQVAHLVHDHGYDSLSPALHRLVHVDGDPADLAAAAYFASLDDTARAAWHSVDHNTIPRVRVRVDRDPAGRAVVDHRHYRDAAAFARAVVAACGSHATYAEDPGGWLSYVLDGDLDGWDNEASEPVATAAGALLEHDATWLEAGR